MLNYTEVAKSTVQVSKAKDRASYMLLWTEGLYVSTKYLFVYLPDDVIDEKIVSVKKWYNGLSKDLTTTDQLDSQKKHRDYCGECVPVDASTV